jgi:hypothetical protein
MSPGYRSEQRILQHVALIHLIAISKNLYGGYGKSTGALNMLNSDVGEGKVLSQQHLDPFDLREESKEDGDVKSSMLLYKRDVSS